MRRHLLCALLLALATPRASHGQSEPEAAALAYGNAIKASDWAAAARLMYPEALKQLRSLYEPLVAMPSGEQVGVQLFGVHSPAEFAATPDTVLFAALLRNSISQGTGLGEALQAATITPLGHVPAGGDTVLVVIRMRFEAGGVTLGQFEVMPFLLQDGRWWGLLKADITNMAAVLQSTMTRQ